ncbi:MAG: hypothetical protein AAGI23_11285 [Bacteroidota bacterium]
MFSEKYPNLDYWIYSQGWIEMGSDHYSSSLIRILDEGGMYYEDEESTSLDEALEKADRWMATEIEERFGEEPVKRYDD